MSAPSFACFVDAHVHIYPDYDLDRLVASASANVTAAALKAGAREPPLCYLLLSETARDNAFGRLRSLAGRLQPGGWCVEPTAEPEAVRIVPDAGIPLVVVAGRQLRTAEGLEVLALATTASFADDRPLDEAIAQAHDTSPLVVLPWGFGKWTGRRGALIETALREDRRLHLGDNRGRPAMAPDPAAFAIARETGRHILPGSDPLPLPAAERDVAAYGCVVRGPIAESRPVASLLHLLSGLAGELPSFGRRVGAVRCLRDQMALRLRRRHGSLSAAPLAP